MTMGSGRAGKGMTCLRREHDADEDDSRRRVSGEREEWTVARAETILKAGGRLRRWMKARAGT